MSWVYMEHPRLGPSRQIPVLEEARSGHEDAGWFVVDTPIDPDEEFIEPAPDEPESVDIDEPPAEPDPAADE